MRAVILAGGQGARLQPHSPIVPKPLAPVGDGMPIVEIIIRQLANAGFDSITLAVNHRSDMVMAFCGDGSTWGVTIDYSIEQTPLGTAGPLTLITDLPDNFLVMNGDVLCDLDYKAFWEHHIGRENRVTVSTYRQSLTVESGVLEYDGDHALTHFVEKPTYEFDVSMGIYCLHRRALEAIPDDQPYGFDQLLLRCLRDKHKVGVWPFDGFWFDIGRPEEYDRVNERYDELKTRLAIDRVAEDT